VLPETSIIANALAKEAQQKWQMLFPITLVPFDRVTWGVASGQRVVQSSALVR
jgi:hypothetical protein